MVTGNKEILRDLGTVASEMKFKVNLDSGKSRLERMTSLKSFL